MPSNVTNLNAELEAREDHRVLTPKQEITIKLRNHYIEQAKQKRVLTYHQVAYNQRLKEYKELADNIEFLEERLLLS
tara:strand:+ start:218 stop:448 length:231 start_codon:yes stop_codon:yes gene_type:complete